VSDDVVVAMLRTEDNGYPGGYPVGYYAPYYSPYYSPYYAPWYLGLDFDFGYSRPYYHAYAPIYGGRGYVATGGGASVVVAAADGCALRVVLSGWNPPEERGGRLAVRQACSPRSRYGCLGPMRSGGQQGRAGLGLRDAVSW